MENPQPPSAEPRKVNSDAAPSTEAEIRLARYRKVEREADEMGRIIGVRRLRPSEQGKLQGMTADLTGHEIVKTDDGQQISVSHRTPYVCAAAVCEIDGLPVPFPKNRGELDAIYDRLDYEGVKAAATAMARLDPAAETKPLDEAKNL